MKKGALALAVAVLALTVGAALLTMRSGGTTPAKVIPKTATTLLNPVKRVLGSKPRCQSDDEGGDKTGEDRSSKSCDSEAGDEKDSGANENEPDEKDSGD